MLGDLVEKLTFTVGFASLAEIKTKEGVFRNAVHRVRMGALRLGIPFCRARDRMIISALYDQRYHDEATYLPILAVTRAIAVIPSGYQNALLALGKCKCSSGWFFISQRPGSSASRLASG